MSRIDPTTWLLAILAVVLTAATIGAAALLGTTNGIVMSLLPIMGGGWAALYRHITGPAMTAGESQQSSVVTNKQAEPQVTSDKPLESPGA